MTGKADILKLRALAVGCKQHPAYRAIKLPRVECDVCEFLYGMRQSLSEPLKGPLKWKR